MTEKPMTERLFQGRLRQGGYVLIEALIAILIFSIGVLALVGLQAEMAKNTSDSQFRAEATYIAQQRIGVMWADPDHLASYIENNTDISDRLPGGTRTTVQSGVEFTVTVSWQQPGEERHNFSTTASITGG